MVPLCEAEDDRRRDDLVTKRLRLRIFVSRQAGGEDAVRGVILATCVLLAAVVAAGAESTKPAQRFVCVFDEHVPPKTTRLSNKNTLRIEFIVDGSGHAFAVGRNVNPVKVISGIDGMTFLEVLVTGAVQTTTMNKRGEAVHSRHTIILGSLVPGQYYGTCE